MFMSLSTTVCLSLVSKQPPADKVMASTHTVIYTGVQSLSVSQPYITLL